MHDALCLAASTRSLLSSLHLKVTPPAACLLLFRIDTGVILPPVLPLGDTPPIQQIGFTVSLRQHWNSISKREHFVCRVHILQNAFFVIKTGVGVAGCMDQCSPSHAGKKLFLNVSSLVGEIATMYDTLNFK